MLKASLHVHIQGDRDDYIRYTGFELLDRAATLGFDVIAFTSHERVIYTRELADYAASKKILLIPGVELNLGGHVLVINATPEAQLIDTLDELRAYKKTHPDCLTIAAHPFFPRRKLCFQESLEPNIDAFDAIEHSWFYSRWIDWNKKALALAKKYDRPVIATSDVHLLEQLENGYVLIDAPKNPKAIVSALKQKKFKSFSKPQGLFEMWWVFAKMNIEGSMQWLPGAPPHVVFEHESIPEKHKGKGKKKS